MANVTNIKGREETRGGINQTSSDFRQRAEGAIESTKEQVSSITEKAKDYAGNLSEKAKDAASAVGDKADDAASAVGSGMRSLAGSIREKTPDEGVLGRAGDSVAGSLERGGRYLQEEGLSGMAEDFGAMIRRNPIPAMFVGLGVGFLLARLLTPRR